MTVVEGIEVTPSEVREYYENLPQDSIPLINEEVELSQIVKYPEISKEAEQEVIDKLKSLKERIENGTSFSSMAILYSEDPGSNKKVENTKPFSAVCSLRNSRPLHSI